MKDIKYIIADNIKLYRKKENLTQMELAERADLSLDSIKRLERGLRMMSLENFLRVSDASQAGVYFYEISSKCFYGCHMECSASN